MLKDLPATTGVSISPKSEPIPLKDLWDIPCVRCGQPSQCQWSVCANNGQYVPMCIDCDIALNHLVLTFLNFDDPDTLVNEYTAKLVANGLMD